MEWTLQEALSHYQRQGAPGDQNALRNLLKEIQEEFGGSIPPALLPELAAFYGVRESLFAALIRQTPSLRLRDRHLLELCAGPNCGKTTQLLDYARQHPGTQITVKAVPCMRLCGKGPNLRWDGKLYHKADLALLERLFQEAEYVQ